MRGAQLLPLTLSLAAGCIVTDEDRALAYDRDHDGHDAFEVGGDDCDDGDPDVYPAAPESCLDDLDSDCDGRGCPARRDTLLTVGARWAAGAEGAALGRDVVLADLDGDGLAELVLGEAGEGAASGRVLVTALPTTADPTTQARGWFAADDGAGLRVGTPGDLDGDGDAELAVAATDGPAQVWLLDDLRDATAPAAAVALTVTDEGSGGPGGPPDPSAVPQRFGGVRALGDREGDGRGEWLLASPGYAGFDADRGAVFLFVGTPAPGDAAALAVATIHGAASGDALGLSDFGGAPDLDGDGLADALLDAPGYRPDELGADGGPDTSNGGLFGFTGDLAGVSTIDDADLRIVSLIGTARIQSGGRAGDVDGDGYDDLGAFLGAGAGEFLLFRGPIAGTHYPNDADVRLIGGLGDTLTTTFGSAWSGEVDVDGDARDDVFVSAPLEGTAGLGAGPDQAGATYLFPGPLWGVQNPDHAAARWVGALPGGQQGLARAADLDGDGVLDLLVGADQAWPDTAAAGTPGAPGAIFLLSAAFSTL